MTRSYLRETCRVCGSHDLHNILPLKPTPSGDAYTSESQLALPEALYPLDLLLCGHCAMSQLSCVVDPNVLYGNFLYTTSISLGLVDHFRNYADSMGSLLESTSGRLAVDIGSNDGTLLKFLQERGMKVLGVEPAASIAEQATRSGVLTMPVFFTPDVADQIRIQRGPASLITSNNTLANVDDVGEFVQGVRSLLGADGVFAFETGYLLDIVDNLLFDTIYHEHLSYFLVHSLCELFDRHGMELIDVQRISTKGGSMRGIAQHVNGSRPVLPSVAAALAEERDRGFLQASSYEPFGNQVRSVRDTVQTHVKEIAASGKTLAGYGASVGVTTLLYYFEIAEHLAFLADDNPAKYNLYSPGYHIPVMPSSELPSRMPDYTLLLAWRYGHPIMTKHQEYRNRGGHFIRFLPVFEIV